PASYERGLYSVIWQIVTNALPKNTFAAVPEFLNTIDVFLGHPPRAVPCIWRSWLELLDLFLHFKIPRHIRNQIFDDWKRLHRLYGDRFVERQVAHACHSH